MNPVLASRVLGLYSKNNGAYKRLVLKMWELDVPMTVMVKVLSDPDLSSAMLALIEEHVDGI